MTHLSTSVVASQSLPQPYFDVETGKPSAYFMGLYAKMEVEQPPSWDVSAVAKVLDKTCFNKELGFWRKNNKSRISYEGAVALLDYELKNRVTLIPEKGSQAATAIMPQGILPTIAKRMPGFVKALEAGSKFDRLLFVAKDNKEALQNLNFIHANYGTLLEQQNISVEYVIPRVEKNLFEEALKLEQAKVAKEYVIIADPAFAGTAVTIAQSIFKDKTCLGAASAPLKDWKVERDLYGYFDEKSQSAKDSEMAEKLATEAWANDLCNFIARQVFAEEKSRKQYLEKPADQGEKKIGEGSKK
jgi:hypothetical protein